jgi:putative peptide zinc metalloprotease protein
MTPVHWLIVGSIFAGLFVPYHYEPGGNFVLLPNQKSELTSEIGGVISAVYFDGGDFLRKGTVIAKLSSTDYEGMVKVYEAKISEQRSVVDDLKSRPKPEEAELARRALEVRDRQALFSGQKLKRLEKLYKENTISQEEFEDQRKQAEVDAEQVREYRAKLKLVEAGATDEEIAAAEAKMQSYREERDYYKAKITQSMIVMPFDGRLEGVNLKLKSGHFLNKGELFATAQNTNQIFAEIEVPEPDIAYVAKSSKIRVRPLSYTDREFNGIVTAIDPGVTEKSSGRVVKVVTLLDNKNELLKSGMTGYAKISAENVPIGKVLSRGLVRFFEVEVWSWLP